MYKNNFLTTSLKPVLEEIKQSAHMLSSSGLPIVGNAFINLSISLERAVTQAEFMQEQYINKLLFKVYGIDSSDTHAFKLNDDISDIIRYNAYLTNPPIKLIDLSNYIRDERITVVNDKMLVYVAEDIYNVFEIITHNNRITDIRSVGIQLLNPIDGETVQIGCGVLPVCGDVDFINHYLRPLFLSPGVLNTNKPTLINEIFALLEEMYQFRQQSPNNHIDVVVKGKYYDYVYESSDDSVYWSTAVEKLVKHGTLINEYYESGLVHHIDSSVHYANRVGCSNFEIMFFKLKGDEATSKTYVISSYPIGSTSCCLFTRSDEGVWNSDIPVEHFKLVLLHELKLKLTSERAKEYLIHKK